MSYQTASDRVEALRNIRGSRLTKWKGVVVSCAPTMGAVALAISTLGVAGAANAANECGVEAVGADTIICNADGTPVTNVAAQPGGISYINSDGLTLVINNAAITVPNTGVSVTGSATNVNAITVTGTAFNTITTTANNSSGLNATNAGTAGASVATMEGGTITTGGTSAHGLYSNITNTSSTATATALLTGGAVETAGNHGYGVYAVNLGNGAATATMNGGSVDTAGILAHGVYSYTSNATNAETSTALMISGDITATGSGYALYARSSGLGDTLAQMDGGTATTIGGAGLYAHGVASLIDNRASSATATALLTSGDVITQGANGSGLLARNLGLGDVRAQMDGGTVTTGGVGAYGLYSTITNTSSAATSTALMTSGTVATSGQNGHGVHSLTSGTGLATATVAGDAVVNAGGVGADGIRTTISQAAATYAVAVDGTASVTGGFGTGAGIHTVSVAGSTGTVTVGVNAVVDGSRGAAGIVDDAGNTTMAINGKLLGGISAGAGNDVANLNAGSTITGSVAMGDGSDVVRIASGADVSGLTLLDGGDDLTAADGFIDVLSVDGLSGAVDGSIIRNWEEINVANSNVQVANLVAGAVTVTASTVVATNLTADEVTLANSTTTLDGTSVVATVNTCGGVTTLTGSTAATDVLGCASDDTIVINGDAVVANAIEGAGGSDSVSVLGNASAAIINVAGDGSDASAATDAGNTVLVNTTGTVGTVIGGDQADAITLTAGTVGTVVAGGGADTIIANGADVTTNIDAGDGDDTVTWSAGAVGSIAMGDGSDTLTVTAVEYDGTQILDGGDDASSADGMIDALTLGGATVAANGATVSNWEVLAFDAGATVTLTDIVTETVTASCGGSTTLDGASAANDVLGCASDDTIVIDGDTVIANAIEGAGGDDTISVLGNASVATVNVAGDGSDASALTDAGNTVLVNTTGTVGTVLGGEQADAITLTAGTVDAVLTGGGVDTIVADGADVTSIDAGAGDDTATWSAGAVGSIAMGDGSDVVTIASGADVSGLTLLDGGDDLTAGDGFIDVLSVDGLSGAVDGSIITNWEEINVANSDVQVTDLVAGAVSVTDSTVVATNLTADEVTLANSTTTLDGTSVVATVNTCGGVTTLTGSTAATDVLGCASDDTIVIDGDAVVANAIEGAGGSDSVSVLGNASAAIINVAGDGSDASAATDNNNSVLVNTTGTVGTVIGGDQADAITLTDGTVGTVVAGGGADTIIANGADVTTSIDAGAGNDIVTWSAGTVAAIATGLGSDALTVSASEYDGSQVLNGGDDLTTADGMVDTLTFKNLTVAATGANVTNWENVVIDGGTVSFSDNALTTGSDAGTGLSIVNGGALDAGDAFALTGNLTVNAGSTFDGTGAGAGVYSISGNLANNGIVTTKDGVVGDTITVAGNYSGTGILSVDIDTATDTMDTLVIAGDVTGGPTTVVVNNLSPLGASGNALTVIAVGGTSAAGDFVLDGGSLTAGAFDYNLAHQGSNFVLASAVNSTGAVYQAAPSVLSGLNSLPTLEQRVGQRQWAGTNVARGELQPSTGGWLRLRGDKLKASNTTGVNADTSTWGLQAGIDYNVETGGEGQWVLGVTGQYGKLGSTITNPLGFGKIDAEGFGIGATATWYGTKGTYVDLQGQVNWISSDMSSSAAGSLAEGELSKAYALSAEVGHRFELDQNTTLVPQAQLTFGKIQGASFTDSAGNAVDLGSNTSMIGRLGLAYEYENNDRTDGNRTKAYVIGNILHDFSKDSMVNVAGANLSSANSGKTWGEIGLGGSVTMDTNKTIFGEASYRDAFNGGSNKGFGLTAGLRVQW